MSHRSIRSSLVADVVAAVRDLGPTSRAQVTRILGASPASVGRTVEKLLDRGILRDRGPDHERGRGRPSTLLEFEPKVASVVAVDLRLTEAYCAKMDLGGAVLGRATRPLTVNDQKSSTSELLALLHEMLATTDGSPPVRALVVGAPSIVAANEGLVEWAPSLGWRNLPLGDILRSEFKLTVIVENDVNLAALGEAWKGVARRAHNMVFVSVGTGIGAGIIIEDELYHGSSHAAGEVSYFLTDILTLRDNAGQVGTLEMRIARDGILRLAQLIAQRYPASRLSELIRDRSDSLRAQDIFALALESDPAAQVVFNETVDLLTIVICNISVVLDTEVIVLGGPSDWKWPFLVEAIRTRIGSALLRPVNLQPSSLGRDALILGAARLAIGIEGVLPT